MGLNYSSSAQMQLRAPCALPFDPTWFAYVWAAPRSMAEEDRHKEATAAARVEREAPGK